MADPDTETIVLRDQFGVLRLPLSELPGRLLKLCMLLGAVTLLKGEPDCRSTWLAWKDGLMPRYRKPAKPRQPKPRTPRARKPKAPRPFSRGRLAILEALRGSPGYRATDAESEALVRAMTANQVGHWLMEPAVQLIYRRLSGEKQLQLGLLLDQLNNPLAHRGDSA